MLISILIFLVVLSVLVLVHELGHFIMARRAGVWVEEFGFGLPPRIIGKKFGQTVYSINLLPFGGFVRLHGENYGEGVAKPRKSFLGKSKRARISIVIAGVVMNFLLALVCFSIVYLTSGIPKDTHQIKVVDISQDSPTVTPGLLVGDVIVGADGKSFTDTNNFINYVDGKKGQKVKLQTENRTLTATPRENPPQGEGPLGIIISTTEIYYPPVWQRPFYGIFYGFKDALFWGRTIAVGLWSLIAGLFAGHVPQGVSGPVGIYAITVEAARSGIITLINFVGILSVNLAILNIIPFPALDGGRLLFIGIEAAIGKKVLPKVETTIHSVGMAILLFLILLITIGDVRHLISAGSINGFIDQMIK